MGFILEDMIAGPSTTAQGESTPSPILPPSQTPVVKAPKAMVLEDMLAKPSVTQGAAPAGQKTSLTYEDVANDPERLNKIRKMMSKTKDIYYEKAPVEEVLTDFMSHMRWMNTNEVSTAKESLDIYAADDETKAVYGEAYKVYNEMGSMFSNGDAWNGVIDYGSAFVTSPSLWLGVGIGKVAGAAGTKAAAKLATQTAINVATKEIVKKSAGAVTAQTVRTELSSTAAKAAARYHIAGALAAEAPLAAFQDYLYQDLMMETEVQDEYSFLQGAISTAAGGFSAIPGIVTLRRGSNSTFADAGKLIDDSFKQRAKTAAKRSAPKIKASLEKATTDWAALANAGRGLPSNPALDKAISNWFFDVNDENSLFRIIVGEGAELDITAPRWTDEISAYALNMGDEALEEFNKALEPLGMTFGEVVERVTFRMADAGETFNPASLSKRFYNEFKNVTIAKKTSAEALAKNMSEETGDVPLSEKDVFGYVQSTWKKNLVSTYATTAVNVKGWALARSSTALADIALAGGLLGRAGIKSLINPSAALKDLGKVRSLAQNQVFGLQSLVDPFLSAEAFNALMQKAPTKVKKRVSGQIFGGVADFSPERFGLDSSKGVVKGVEKYSNFFQKISFVHLQDTLTKGVSGLIALDKETRLAFGKGIQEMIEAGETFRITDDMWERTTNAVMRETFSEDLTKGKDVFSKIGKVIETISNDSVGGFFIPFGRFLNNTAAFVYRHSPLALVGITNKALRSGPKDDLGEMVARAAVGSIGLAYFYNDEKKKQAEGLQWFEHRGSDGSVQNITNMFPYSVYALVGRIIHNGVVGEGMDKGLIEALLQQVGPIEALEQLSLPTFVKDFTRWATDVNVDTGERNEFFSTIGDASLYVGAQVAEIAAGVTRPLDTYSRTASYMNPEFGGGMIADPKQAEGVDKIVLGLTRYTSAFFNLMFGEETEYGTRLLGKPRESAISNGPVKIPNPVATASGSTVQPQSKNINKLLGMVDKPPYKADSFTSGNAEYDAFINKHVTPLLEAKAKSLLSNEVFLKAPMSIKMDRVDNMIKEARDEVLNLLEGRRLGDEDSRLLDLRRKLLVKDRPARQRAMKALGITTPERRLSRYEIDAIERYMDIESDQIERIK